MKIKPINSHLLFVLCILALISYSGSECMHSASTFNALVSFIPPESEGLLVCEVPQVLKAPATRSLLAGLEAEIGFDPVELFDTLLQNYLGITRYHVQRLAFFWLDKDNAAREDELQTISAPAPVEEHPKSVQETEVDTWETGLILQLGGLRTDKLVKALSGQPGIKEVKLPGGTGEGTLPAVSYYRDESFNVCFFLHADYLFFADSPACLEKLLNRYRAAALATSLQRATQPEYIKRESLFSAPEFGSAVNNKSFKLFIKPTAINGFLRNLEKQTAEQLLPPALNTQSTAGENTVLTFTPLPTSTAESFRMLGIGLNLAGNMGLDVCFIYDEGKEHRKAQNNTSSVQATLNQASLINNLGWSNYMNIQKALSKPSYVFKKTSISVRGNISKELLPQANRYLLSVLHRLFPYQYYFDETARSGQ